MDVSSVNKPVVKPTAAPKPLTESHQQPVRVAKHAENESPKVAQTAAKPVINTQGQVTGRHLNVTA